MIKKQALLLNEQEALTDYLQALLNEVPEADVEIKTEVEVPLVQKVITAEPAVEIIEPPVQTQELAPPVIKQQIVAAEPKEIPVVETETQTGSMLPAWASAEFEALLFSVCGLKLAVPLAELNGILEWPESATPMPGHSPWFIGLHKNLDETVKLIDVALLVVPEKHRQTYPQDPAERVKRIVLIGGGKWGLACDAVAEVITLQPENVRWRTAGTRRKWLAGTVIDHMCALLDVEEFADMLGSDDVEMAR